MTPVQFHQVVRATTPVFTIILSSLLLGKASTRARVIALVPVVAGVGLAYVRISLSSGFFDLIIPLVLMVTTTSHDGASS